MKLAEALLLRADLQKKLASLRERLTQNAIVQEGERPAENPDELLTQAARVLDQLEILIFKINQANLEYRLKDGASLTAALAKRDVLVLRHSALEAVASAAARPPDRYGMKEIKWLPTIDVARLRKQVDDLAKQIRELNGAIQEANWNVEIEL
jgi:hypothetical protein